MDYRLRDIANFLLKTWTGRLIALNTAVFVVISITSGSLLMPTSQVLIAFGAKEPVLLTEGQIWRLITPIFVHIGLIHFLFNTWALYIIGNELEAFLTKRAFLFIYLAAGIVGNLASAIFTLNLSAGASGALFGLLGSGFYIERKIRGVIAEGTNQKPRLGAYTMMIIANLILGIIVPQIDNAAHMGGLITGIIATWGLFRLRPNRFVQHNRLVGQTVVGLLLATIVIGSLISASSKLLVVRLEKAAQSTSDPLKKYRYFSDALRVQPDRCDLHFKRGVLLLKVKYYGPAAKDFRYILNDPTYHQRYRKELWELMQKLDLSGNTYDAIWLEGLLSGKFE